MALGVLNSTAYASKDGVQGRRIDVIHDFIPLQIDVLRRHQALPESIYACTPSSFGAR